MDGRVPVKITMIELNAFSKMYAATPAVRDVSLVCREGTVTGLLGENGAGKTTILRAVCAQHFATSGTVRVNGIDAAEFPAEVRALTGFVGEQVRLPPEYTVQEYLTMRARLYGLEMRGGAAEPVAVARVIAQCALEDVQQMRLRALSKGYAERVRFAQALVHNPPVLVLDEPAGGLDPAQIVRLRALVKRLLPSHTVLLSTHLMQEVDALCDYVYIMHRGRCVAHGTAAEIAAAHECDTLEQAFFKLTIGTDSADARGSC